jgi:hypothetical protein
MQTISVVAGLLLMCLHHCWPRACVTCLSMLKGQHSNVNFGRCLPPLLEWLLLQVDMLYGRKIQAVPEQVRWIQSFTVSCRAHIPSRQSAGAADRIAPQLLRHKFSKSLGYQASSVWPMQHHDRSGAAPVSELLHAQAQPPSFCIGLHPCLQVPGQFVGVRPPGKGNGLGDNQKLYSIACSPYESRRDSAYIGGSIIEVCHP